jgi:hypothetical protein
MVRARVPRKTSAPARSAARTNQTENMINELLMSGYLRASHPTRRQRPSQGEESGNAMKHVRHWPGVRVTKPQRHQDLYGSTLVPIARFEPPFCPGSLIRIIFRL